jgi:hypothetical protein
MMRDLRAKSLEAAGSDAILIGQFPSRRASF